MSDFFSNYSIEGVIFDCDGVLVNSELLSCGALNVIFEKYFAVDIGRDYGPVIGKRLQDSFDYYIKKFKISVPPSLNLQELYRQKDQAYQDLARNNLQTFPGVISLLNYLKKSSLRIGVASSGTKEKILFNLHEGKIKNYFQTITSADEVRNGKPHPDLFLLSAKKLNCNPIKCLVIEDAVTGIKAAKSAGMMAVGVTNSFKKEDLLVAGADKIVTRLDEML